MDNERDRPSWPDEDSPTQPTAGEPGWDAPTEPTEPPASDADVSARDAWSPSGDAGGGADERLDADVAAGDRPASDAAAPAEIESWPSQEPAGATHDETRAWPTEPPAAGSATSDAWPTAAPERSSSGMSSDDAWATREPEPSHDVAGVGPSDPMEAAAVAAAGEASDARDPSTYQPDRAPEEVEAYPATDSGSVVAPAAAHAVPDAEGSTGESTQCPRCGTENRPGLSFCRNCGQRLVAAGAASTVERPGVPEGTQACPRCGTHNRAGVAFCQNCGANLRGTSEAYVPPAAAADDREVEEAPRARGAVLGPVVLLIGLAGLITGYLLPFIYGSSNSLFERAWAADGYGIAFWNGYPEVGASLADQAYFGLTAPIPLLALIVLALAVAGFVRAAPGMLQSLGLGVVLLWSVALIVLFLIVEVAANWNGDMVGLLRALTPAGIIFFLSSLILLIGTLTRFSRG